MSELTVDDSDEKSTHHTKTAGYMEIGGALFLFFSLENNLTYSYLMSNEI